MRLIKFNVSNYRSLVNVTLPKLGTTVLFYGLNNSGKSNILAILESIFQRKVPHEVIETSQESRKEIPVLKPRNFWTGKLEPFVDNTFGNNKKDINFSVEIILNSDEIKAASEGLKRLDRKGYAKGGSLGISGRIEHLDDQISLMHLSSVTLNKRVVYVENKAGKISYFPSIKGLNQAEAVALFEQLLEPLNDCFKVISCGRGIVEEKYSTASTVKLSPATFKSWLHFLSLDRDRYPVYERIKQIFNSDPFSFGEISFATMNEELEIMVKKDGLRLPIDRLGSGLQQIIYIVASVVNSRGKMVGIEELEQNLSPEAQHTVFEMLKQFAGNGQGGLSQLFITSHSPVFAERERGILYFVERKDLRTEVSEVDQRHEIAFREHFIPILRALYPDDWEEFVKMTNERFDR